MLRNHLLYLTSEQLCVYHWRMGKLTAGPCFAPDEDGIDAFMDYIDDAPVGPCWLLTDLIEEDYQRVTLPHVSGKAGRQMLQRRLTQQYRETPFRHVSIQGREPEGRRDDIALLSGLTNPSIVQPWIAALEALKAPLAGLYTTTLMSDVLRRKLGLRQEHLLLVTEQSGGLRQTYFRDGQLKFSRLTLAIDRDGVPVNVAAETGKTLQFLTSVHLMERGDVLHTAIVTPADQIERLSALCRNGPETAYRFIAIETAAAKVGLPYAPRLADPLLLKLLGGELPRSHYTLGEARRYYQLWWARVAMYGASAAILTCTLMWAAVSLWRTSEADNAAMRMRAETARYDSQYQAVMSDMPPAVAKTANMKAAVAIERMLAEQGPVPLPMVRMLSQALEQAPLIKLNRIDWRVNLPGAAPAPSAMGAPADSAASTPIPSQLLGLPTAPPQALHLEAEIGGPQDDYRAALEAMRQFAQRLAALPHMTVEIESQPLDTRPNVKLSGKAGMVAGGAVSETPKFALNLVWNPS
ncbi:hypothetical protein [Rugamonas apoptosis]|uniref:Uncharacterized protein n=1 Tax=Rugamonas apoptosis TaxID=2758570 RepID=A0A7W2F9C7_9BURK|nr:hypothetical protein [Rugamonas apoptosis]MBA5687550.1 hypothetical protein [Rugamonas apoptosis]